MRTLSKSLATSMGCSKSGTSSARSHLLSGKLDESRSIESKSKGLQEISHLHDTPDASHSRKSQKKCALLPLTGYSSSEEEPTNHQSITQAQRVKRQQPQVKDGPRKRVSAAKYKSSEFVESDSNSEVDVSGVHARPSLGRQDSDFKSGKRHPSSISLHNNTSHTEGPRNLKGTHKGSLSVSKDIRRRVIGSPRRSKPTVTINKHGGKAMERRAMSSSASRVDPKRPRLLGGFVDNESEPESDFEPDGSEASANSDGHGDEEPGSDLEITANWKSKAAKFTSRQLPLEKCSPAPNPTSLPPQKTVNFSRVQKLIREKKAKAAGRVTSSNTSSEQASTKLASTTGSMPGQATLRGAPSSSSMSPNNLERSPSLTQNSTSDRSALGGPKLLPAKNTARGSMHGDSTQANEMPPRPTNSKPALNALSMVKPVQNASRSARNQSQFAARPGSVLPPTKKPVSTTNYLGMSSSTAMARHATQRPGSAVPLQGRTGMTGNSGVVGDLIQDIRQGGKPNNAATTNTSTSTPVQVRKVGSDSQMRGQTQNVKTTPQSQTPHQIRSGPSDSFSKPIESPSAPQFDIIDTADTPRSGSKPMTKQSGSPDPSCMQRIFAHQIPGASTSGVIDNANSQSKPTRIQTMEPQPASQTPAPHSLNMPNTPNLQAPNGVSSIQKRKTEDMTSGSSIDLPLAKRPAIGLTRLNTGARPSTGASEPAKFGRLPLSSKSTAVFASSAGNKTVASMPTSTMEQKSQIPAATITGQEKASTASATANRGPKVQKQTLQNVPKEVAPNSGPAIFEALTAGNNPVQPRDMQSLGGSQQQLSVLLARIAEKKAQVANPEDARAQKCTQSPHPNASIALELLAAANASVKNSSPAVQASKVPIVAQVHDAVSRQVPNQVHKEKKNPPGNTEKSLLVHTSSSEPIKPADLSKATPKILEKMIPAEQLTRRSATPATDSPASVTSRQRPRSIASRRESTPVVIPSTSSALLPNAEPYFEYSIFQKLWSEAEDELTTTATELTSRPSTNIDDSNSQAERLFNNMLRQYQEHFKIHLFERTDQSDEYGCNVFKGTFARIDYLHKKSHMKLWVQRDHVSAYAGRREKDLKHTSFIAKTVYMLRLFKLVPATTGSDTDDSTATSESTRVYHPLSCTECYTTVGSANRAAKNLQIELSHTKNPKAMGKLWQVQNLEQLNKKARNLAEAEDEEGRYWKTEFNGTGLGSATYELLVEKVGLCGPRNL
jgi:hypothetical protein